MRIETEESVIQTCTIPAEAWHAVWNNLRQVFFKWARAYLAEQGFHYPDQENPGSKLYSYLDTEDNWVFMILPPEAVTDDCPHFRGGSND